MITSPQVDAWQCAHCGRNTEPDIAIELDYCSACGHPIEPPNDPGKLTRGDGKSNPLSGMANDMHQPRRIVTPKSPSS